MTYDLTTAEDRLSLRLAGTLTYVDGESFKNALGEIETGAKPVCVVEMAGLSFVDSFGLGLLVVLYDLAEKLNMRLILRHAAGVVRERLNYTRFDTIVALED